MQSILAIASVLLIALIAFPGAHAQGSWTWETHTYIVVSPNPVGEIPGFYNGESVAIADGYLVTYNGYDNRIYCFGKGKTAIKLSASPKIVTEGNAILIKGRVIDNPLELKTPQQFPTRT